MESNWFWKCQYWRAKLSEIRAYPRILPKEPLCNAMKVFQELDASLVASCQSEFIINLWDEILDISYIHYVMSTNFLRIHENFKFVIHSWCTDNNIGGDYKISAVLFDHHEKWIKLLAQEYPPSPSNLSAA
jgi:hypothetical protein